MSILLLVLGSLAIGAVVAVIASRRSAGRNERRAEPRRSYGSSGGREVLVRITLPADTTPT